MDKLYKNLSEFEDMLYHTLICFGYCLVSENSFENRLKSLYELLPQDIKDSKEMLDENFAEGSAYNILRQIEILYRESMVMLGFRLIKINKLIALFDRLYAVLPDNIRYIKGEKTINV